MFTEHSIPVGRLRLNVAEGPRSGPPLWLFHGLSRRWQDFSTLTGSLSSLWSVHAADHRGHGGSSHAPGCYYARDYVADATSLVGEEKEPAVLVGHSLGAMVALGVASRDPESVRAIVLLDPPGVNFLANIAGTSYEAMWKGSQRLAGHRRPLGEVTQELADIRLPGPTSGSFIRLGDARDSTALRFTARCLRDLDPDVFTQPLACRWLDGFDPIDAAANVRCPTLILVGDPVRGGMLPPADREPLVKALADAVVVNVPRVGHLVHWEDTEATLRLMHAFLATV